MKDSPSDDRLTMSQEPRDETERERERRDILRMSQGAVINKATKEGKDGPLPSWEVKTLLLTR